MRATLVRRVLVIEDRAPLRAVLEDILGLGGYKVLLAADGRRGIELAKRERPDLILCDVMMPGLSGYDVLQAVRSEPPTAAIPIVFLTAKGQRANVRTGMNLGADDYLVKPVKVQELLDAVAARLQRAPRPARINADFGSAQPLRKLGLSLREAEILLWIAQGKTNLEAGQILSISGGTVKKHLENIYRKLGVENRNGAALKAQEALSR